MAKMIIAGERVEAAAGKTIEVRDPATGEVVDTVPRADARDVDAAIEAAAKAFPSWSQTPGVKRAEILHQAAQRIRAHVDEIATLLTREQGKPLRDSKVEAGRVAANLEFYAGLADKIRGDYVQLAEPGAFGMVIKRPVGVVAAITPWNFPLTLMANKVSPALAAGCTVVLKPASTTPLATTRCIELMVEAGVPKGAVNVVIGSGADVGDALTGHPKVAKIAFTGQTETGMHIMGIAARGVKRITLELGGSDPAIVCDDADIEKAARAVAIGRFFNAGQACLAIKRLYVFAAVAEQFMQLITARAQKLKVGPGMAEGVMMGPLHTAKQRDEVEAQVDDAVRKGARVLTGAKRPEGAGFAKGFFYLPTVLADVPEDSRMITEEVFGPALPVMVVKDLDEAIEKANASKYGLGSSIFTRDLAKARVAAERIDAGYTWVNAIQVAHDELPFGGLKQSGFGKEHGLEALDGYVERKSVVLAP
jgi:succinate-semialdehyde dehydrogenase/glutarate-semialdehyde dehydrogenase